MTFTPTDISDRLALMQHLSEAARAITLPLFETDLAITNKGDNVLFDPVTEADIEGERVLRQIIRDAFPKDSIEGEELPDYQGENDFSWTLDPIDGTRGFIAGVPVWSTLIALSYQGQPVLGLIDVAAQDKCYWGDLSGETKRAWRVHAGETTTLNTRKVDTLKAAILGCTEPLAMFKPGERAAYEIIRRGVRFSRLGLDAYGYGLLCEGRMDIVIEGLLKPCDVRALMPVIEGAGGKITGWHGQNPVDGGRIVCVGNEALLPELYTYLQRAMDS
ncbi:inositol monophosphatase family protein [Litorimonas sp. RW-G-Af-16]|uniref:inositol monophosphatase family protein n=1 Tax=Litorimonas sp. RW-G-Af-16 TaxID=3241168 RepID=UPI00390CA5AD